MEFFFCVENYKLEPWLLTFVAEILIQSALMQRT